MKLICTSDLHGDFETLKKISELSREFDALIIAGDFTNFTSERVAMQMLGDLKNKVKNLLLVPGNCELPETSALYRHLGISLHGEGIMIGDIGFFGVGGSNPTPFNTPLEYSEEEIKKALHQGYKTIKDAKIKILVTHPPPFETVDKAPTGENVGSKAIKNFLNKNKVDLVICGHIHEAKGSVKVGKTNVVNTGPTFKGYVTARIKEDGSINCEFQSL